MDAAPTYTHGDTAPPLDVELRRERRPVILDESATAEATILRPGMASIVRPATVEELGDALTPARVRIAWQADDLVNTGVEPIDYRVRVVVTTPGVGIESTPAPPRFTVRPTPA